MAEGTTRGPDGEPVAYKAAIAAYTEAAVPVLREIARAYGAWITYGDMAERVQAATGITTGVGVQNWIGEVLDGVTQAQQGSGEPMLAAFVLRVEQKVGPGYAAAVKAYRGAVPDDLDMHAAVERLECYRYFGAEVPANAAPMLPPREAAARATVRAQAPREVCPTCSLQLPRSGVCDNCGE